MIMRRLLVMMAVVAFAVLLNTAPVGAQLSAAPKAWSKNVELVGYNELEKRPAFKMAMQVVDNKWYLYLGHYWVHGWSIVDVTDPSNPNYLKFIPCPGPASETTATNQIQVADGIMITAMQKYIMAGRNDPFEEGIHIWDVKDPVNPKLLSQWKTGGASSGMVGTHRNFYAGGRYVHLAATAPGFSNLIYRILDISDPTKPVEAGRWWVPEQWAAGGGTSLANFHGGAYVEGNRGYLSYGYGGMIILDVSDMTLPKLVGQLKVAPPLGGSATGTGIPVHTVRPLVKRKLAIINSESMDAPVIGGPTCQQYLNYAGVVDISDEKNPRLISILPVPEPPPGYPLKNFCEKGYRFGPHNVNQPQGMPYLEDRDDRIYYTEFNAGLRIYDISDPYLPKEIGYYLPEDPKERRGPRPPGQLVTSTEDVLVDARGYIYITDKQHGLHILRATK